MSNSLPQLLKTTAGTCCVGNTVTMADCCLVPQVWIIFLRKMPYMILVLHTHLSSQVYNAQRFSVDMTAFPLISRLNSNLRYLKVSKVRNRLSPQFCDNFQWAARVWGGPPFHAARLPGGPEVERRKKKSRPMKLQVDMRQIKITWHCIVWTKN